MDRVTNLAEVVADVVSSYATHSLNATLYHLHDARIGTDAVLVVPIKRQNIPHVLIMTRIEDNVVIVETDRTDRPLEDALVDSGIPRAQIVLAYAGEGIPTPNHINE